MACCSHCGRLCCLQCTRRSVLLPILLLLVYTRFGDRRDVFLKTSNKIATIDRSRSYSILLFIGEVLILDSTYVLVTGASPVVVVFTITFLIRKSFAGIQSDRSPNSRLTSMKQDFCTRRSTTSSTNSPASIKSSTERCNLSLSSCPRRSNSLSEIMCGTDLVGRLAGSAA